MKLNTSLLALSTAASALPTAQVSASPNTTPQPIITPGTGHVDLGEPVPPPLQREIQADQYLFNMTLESFITLRDQRYPSYFFWESDGCSQSPDAPFGFPFLPACYRHDFGYDQYKKVCTIKNSLMFRTPLLSFHHAYPFTSCDTTSFRTNFMRYSKIGSRQQTRTNLIATSDQSTCNTSP